MTKEEKIIDLFENVGLIATPIKREGKTVSWQLEGFTSQGGNMIHTLDFSGLDALNIYDAIKAFRNFNKDVDIDDEIDLNLESAREFGLTIREFVHDYEDYYEALRKKAFKIIRFACQLKNLED